jgi:hypothetical protein
MNGTNVNGAGPSPSNRDGSNLSSFSSSSFLQFFFQFFSRFSHKRMFVLKQRDSIEQPFSTSDNQTQPCAMLWGWYNIIITFDSSFDSLSELLNLGNGAL